MIDTALCWAALVCALRALNVRLGVHRWPAASVACLGVVAMVVAVVAAADGHFGPEGFLCISSSAAMFVELRDRAAHLDPKDPQ